LGPIFGALLLPLYLRRRGVDGGEIQAMVAAVCGATVRKQCLVASADQRDRQLVAAAIFDADQLAAAIDGDVGTVERPLQRVGLHPRKADVHGLVPGGGEAVRAIHVEKPVNGAGGEADVVRGGLHRSVAGECGNETALPLFCPARSPVAAAGDGGEIDDRFIRRIVSI
jgi:hypothetical protein